ncbi:hypothetical protein [Vibrio barjaei]|uniref:hypothetical protein n=1 Tax=Vibrio barjaei TaxID=1676683 RepID=UPI002284681B|nr:hypothetical protein [Vibrio barjaei]MCY9874601.1 hypothetical protein [Vibrio barjaei]
MIQQNTYWFMMLYRAIGLIQNKDSLFPTWANDDPVNAETWLAFAAERGARFSDTIIDKLAIDVDKADIPNLGASFIKDAHIANSQELVESELSIAGTPFSAARYIASAQQLERETLPLINSDDFFTFMTPELTELTTSVAADLFVNSSLTPETNDEMKQFYIDLNDLTLPADIYQELKDQLTGCLLELTFDAINTIEEVQGISQ